ncbi:PEP/pyruvate-binding domain-containing protein [Serratia sp. M24T3]|uniref:PEP/pyruvate-binding domain-containing protein n=1 Tax=Serratia sp. M24T3 TaxID=932213 RepID=UPI00025B8DF7|nr:PEP/pyruvate-binding domain-containing protein [Serratia sp. M24T3]EIC86373.1 phosphoenolpyruvate synthase [Serratia sp. M24T3]
MSTNLYEATNIKRVGNKAFNLMRVAEVGIPVPPGFVINNAESPSNKDCIKLYNKYISHGRVSVRSSSDKEDGDKKSAAGIYKTILDVSSDEIELAFQAVRRHSKKSRMIPVIVQKQIEAKTSGVAFSINPINGDNDIYIEYYEGRCENIVSGNIIPRHLVLKKHTYHENDNIPLKLFEFIIQLEMIFNVPVDIEWCIDYDGNVWILQCRPITVIPSDCFRYAWSTREPLWAMEQAFKTRCNDGENQKKDIYLHEEIIYSRDLDKTFHCYIGLKDHISALAYTMKVLNSPFKPVDYYPLIEPPEFVSKDTAVDYFRTLSSLYCKYIRYYMRSASIVTNIIERKLSLKYSRDEIADLLSIGNNDLMFREQNDFSNLDISSNDSITNHVRKYPYLSINYRNRNDMIEGIKSLHLAKEIKCDDKSTENRKMQSLSDMSEDLKHLKLLSTERMHVKNGWAGVYFHMMILMEWISKNHNESQNDLYQSYMSDDIVNLIKNDIKLTTQEKEKRCHGILMKRNKDKALTPRISFGNFFHEDVEAKILPSNNNLHGIPSLKRKVHGVVKIINYETKIDIQSYMGKIVVTEMTQPNMVALFRKCKGIITNEGGVLSHACIISREYNIPCIVGTSNATKVLIDGDEIIMWPNGHISYESDAPYHP